MSDCFSCMFDHLMIAIFDIGWTVKGDIERGLQCEAKAVLGS